MPIFDDRFARQNRCEPPPEFPLASPYSSIVHHLSGPNSHALTQIHPKTSGSVDGAPFRAPTSVRFHCADGFDTRTLAWMLDSLVRVSRRVEDNHFVCIASHTIWHIQSSIHLSHRQNFVLSRARANRPQSTDTRRRGVITPHPVST